MPKIVFVGAGSVVFTKNLVSDILQFPELQDSTITLMDIDPQRLEVAREMATRLARKLRVPARIEATIDRRKAIRGAHYVICTIQVGGYKPGTVIDFEIPRKYGLLQTIGDTLGVGGVFRALRTIPHIVRIAQDIADVGAPNCRFLNYTNPMAMNCLAVDRAVRGVPTVGLCHSVQGTSEQLASYCGLDPREISYKVAGINHMAFFLEFKFRGQDAYPLLFRKLQDPTFTRDKVRFEMMRRLGYFVTESSEHQSEYNPHFIHFGEEMIRRFDVPIDEYLRRCESIIATWKQQEKELLGGESGDIQIRPQTHEYGSYIIHSCETGTPRVIYGNVPNTGLITNLPDRCCVEVPVLVDRQGLQPTVIGDLPPQLAAICRSNINVQELAVEAALTRRREHIYHAVMADPHTAATLPLDRIWALCDEMIAAHQKVGLLGEFSPTIPGTGRAYAGTGDCVVARVELRGGVALEPGTVDGELIVSNPNDKPFEATFTFRTSASGVVPPKPLRVQVPARRDHAFPLRIPVPGPEERFVVDASCTHPGVFVQPLVLEPRTRFDLRTGSVPLAIEVMSVTLVKGSLSFAEGVLSYDLRVADSNVKPQARAPWTGSVLEFFFAPQTSPGAISQYFVLPSRKGAVVLTQRLEPSAELTATCRVDKGGYAVSGSFDLAKLGVLPEGAHAFLFDLIVGACALGDAHGEVRAGLNGRLDSFQRSFHFSVGIVR